MHKSGKIVADSACASAAPNVPKAVYIVDEDRVMRRLTYDFLLQRGFAPRPYVAAQDFLDDASHLPPGCLLLGELDVALGNLRVIELLGDRIAEFPTIVTAPHGDVAAAVRAMKMGASDVIETPFERNSLPAMLLSIFDGLDRRLTQVNSVRKARMLICSLSKREEEVLRCLRDGRSNKMIAHLLGLSLRTVEAYRASMMNRLRVDTLSDALRLAFEAEIATGAMLEQKAA
jgi:two-component system response regulator FixJ